MQLLLIKLLLTPLLMIAVSWAARRWGPGIGGLLAGLPLTSGPISIYFWVEQGPEFATTAASSSLLSLTPVAIFSIVYGRLAHRLQMPACALCALAVFLVSLYFLQKLALPFSHLSTLVDEVLNNSMYRDNARKFQQAIAAGLLEEAFGLTKDVSQSHENSAFLRK